MTSVERMPASGQIKLHLSDDLARRIIANYGSGQTVWYFNAVYEQQFIWLFQWCFGHRFKYHEAGFFSIKVNILLFFLNMGGNYYIQISAENTGVDDQFYVLSLLESVLKN